MAELIIHSGKLQGRRLVLPDRDVTIGRDEDCHMRIASSLVSRKHCVLKSAAEGIWVRDLKSQNGTYVNEVGITEPYLMKPGDVLRVGTSLFRVPEIKTVSPKSLGDKDVAREKISDADISDWLSDDEETVRASIPDTTVIKGRQQSASDPAAETTARSAQAPASEGRTAPSSPANQAHRSIKEQAAEIIRRHWEMVRARQR